MSSLENSMTARSSLRSVTLAVLNRYIRPKSGIIIALVAMCSILSFLSPAFLSPENLMNVLRQVSTNANLAFGMTFAIIIGGIDLSVGSVLAVWGLWPRASSR